MGVHRACAAGGIHMGKVAVLAAGLDGREQGIACLWIRKAPDTQKLVRAGLRHGGVRRGQRQQLNPQAGQLAQALTNGGQELLALCCRQRLPGGIRGIEFDKVAGQGWGFFQRILRSARWQIRSVLGDGASPSHWLQSCRTQSGWSLAASLSQLATESCT